MDQVFKKCITCTTLLVSFCLLISNAAFAQFYNANDGSTSPHLIYRWSRGDQAITSEAGGVTDYFTVERHGSHEFKYTIVYNLSKSNGLTLTATSLVWNNGPAPWAQFQGLITWAFIEGNSLRVQMYDYPGNGGNASSAPVAGRDRKLLDSAVDTSDFYLAEWYDTTNDKGESVRIFTWHANIKKAADKVANWSFGDLQNDGKRRIGAWHHPFATTGLQLTNGYLTNLGVGYQSFQDITNQTVSEFPRHKNCEEHALFIDWEKGTKNQIITQESNPYSDLFDVYAYDFNGQAATAFLVDTSTPPAGSEVVKTPGYGMFNVNGYNLMLAIADPNYLSDANQDGILDNPRVAGSGFIKIKFKNPQLIPSVMIVNPNGSVIGRANGTQRYIGGFPKWGTNSFWWHDIYVDDNPNTPDEFDELVFQFNPNAGSSNPAGMSALEFKICVACETHEEELIEHDPDYAKEICEFCIEGVDACGVCGGDGSSCTDCLGVPGGDAEYDLCGVCAGDNSSCTDCKGVPNGGAEYDLCGVCEGDDTTCADCKGTPNGDAEYDQCNVCGGDNSSCSDCAGIPNGTNEIDQCGVCGGDGTSCTDCAGAPYGNKTVDQCGVCGGDGTSCLDCEGTPNGNKVVDECGVCGGDNSTCADCLGTPNGTAKRDECGVCEGDGSSCADCEATPNGGKVLDQCGVCGGDGTSCTDCEGVPFGVKVADSNGACCYEHEKDSCGVCFGKGECIDCQGVVNGTATENVCGMCNQPDSACEDCIETDQTSVVMALDGSQNLQRTIARVIVRRIEKHAGKQSSLAKKGRGVLASMGQDGDELWGWYWKSPLQVRDCTAETVTALKCPLQDLSGNEAQILAGHESMDKKLARVTKLLEIARKKAAKKIVKSRGVKSVRAAAKRIAAERDANFNQLKLKTFGSCS